MSANSRKILVDIDSIIIAIPGYTYWKNLKSVYMGCNHNLAKVCNLNSPEEIIGHLDHDFDWGTNLYGKFVEEDQQVIKTRSTLTLTHELIINGQPRTYKTKKVPLIDSSGNIFGVLGNSVDITVERTSEIQKLKELIFENAKYKKKIEENQKILEFIENLQHDFRSLKIEMLNQKLGIQAKLPKFDTEIKLTKREREVIYFLSLNKSPKEIANILSIIENKDLSPLTISSIIDKQLYPKLGVNNISKLLEVANNLKLIPFSIA